MVYLKALFPSNPENKGKRAQNDGAHQCGQELRSMEKNDSGFEPRLKSRSEKGSLQLPPGDTNTKKVTASLLNMES